MTQSPTSPPAEIYNRLMSKVFSSEVPPGTKLVERRLANELGVSRIPVRESLKKMVAQGVLVGGQRGEGVRVRDYSAEEVRQLYELREVIEGGIARAAADNASADELLKLSLIIDQSEHEVGNYGSERWADLDHKFHQTLAAASHNARFVESMRTLLTESHYVFYLHLPRKARPHPEAEEVHAMMQRVVDDHRELLEAIRGRDGEAAERIARAHMRQSATRATHALIASDIE